MKTLKNEKQLITPTDIIHKFTDIVFSESFSEHMTVISKHIDKPLDLLSLVPDMASFRKLSSEEQWELIRQTAPEKRDYVSRIVFNVSGDNYEVLHNHTHGFVLITTDKVESFAFHSNYNEKPSSDVDTFRKVINQMSVEYHQNAFPNEMPSYSKSKFDKVICRQGSRTITPFIDEQMIKLFSVFKDKFTHDEQMTIDEMNHASFNSYCGRSFTDLKEYFSVWMKKLVSNKHTIAKPLVFNDSDNKAYYMRDEDKEMIVQSSQNTIFAYGVDLKTNIFKIWTCAYVNVNPERVESSIKELSKEDSYIDAMKKMNEPYSYYIYPFELDGESYPKSALYFFNNFEDESQYLVFTTKENKGFRLNSEYSECVATDIPLLLQVVYSI